MPYEHDGSAARVVGDENSFLNVQCAGTPGVVGSATGCTNLTTVQFVGKNSPNPNIGTYVTGNDYHSFAPSVGLAWNRSVVRKRKNSSPHRIRNQLFRRTAQFHHGRWRYRNGSRHQLDLGWIGPNVYASDLHQSRELLVTDSRWRPERRRLRHSRCQRPIEPWESRRTPGKSVHPELEHRNPARNRQEHHDRSSLCWNEGHEAVEQRRSECAQLAEASRRSSFVCGVQRGSRRRRVCRSWTHCSMALSLSGGCGVVNGTTCTGAMSFRANTTTRAQLANGNFGAFLNSLNTTLQYVGGPTDAGSILRRAGFPDNYLVPDPQYTTVNIAGNNQNSTYHSLNLQLTRRLAQWLCTTSTYIWSKAMGDVGTSPGPEQSPPDQDTADCGSRAPVQQQCDVRTAVRNRSLPSRESSWLAPEHRQQMAIGWGYELSHRCPIEPDNVAVATGLQTISNSGAYPNVVGTDSRRVRRTAESCQRRDLLQWVHLCSGYPDIRSRLAELLCFNQPHAMVCLRATATERSAPAPARRAPDRSSWRILSRDRSEAWDRALCVDRRRFRFDMSLVKRFKITETKQFEFRIAAVNVLNHPNFAAPTKCDQFDQLRPDHDNCQRREHRWQRRDAQLRDRFANLNF